MAEMSDPKKTVSLLNDLIHLDFDAIAAYQAAIDRLHQASDKAQLGRFLADHRRHIVDLTPLVEDNGGNAVTEADYKEILTKGKVVIAGLMGDRAVLEAMKSNEDTTNQMYEKATREPSMTTRVRTVLERNLADERRHRAWIEQRLAAMSSTVDMMGRDKHR
ncbi:MAG TPA: DUF2383 domain-containing protein [Polyangiaceae bacterium]|jgi:uncharacterized protein (TIGR02284 family)